jgi:alpha-galactosidase
VARQIAWYLDRRQVLQLGRFLRLRSPFDGDGNETAWMVVDQSGSHAVVGFYRVLGHPLPVRNRLRLRGLDPAATYRVTTWMDTFEAPVASVDRAGDELMAIGLGIEPPDMPFPRGESSDGTRIVRGDFGARLFELTRA